MENIKLNLEKSSDKMLVNGDKINCNCFLGYE